MEFYFLNLMDRQASNSEIGKEFYETLRLKIPENLGSFRAENCFQLLDSLIKHIN